MTRIANTIALMVIAVTAVWLAYAEAMDQKHRYLLPTGVQHALDDFHFWLHPLPDYEKVREKVMAECNKRYEEYKASHPNFVVRDDQPYKCNDIPLLDQYWLFSQEQQKEIAEFHKQNPDKPDYYYDEWAIKFRKEHPLKP